MAPHPRLPPQSLLKNLLTGILLLIVAAVATFVNYLI